MTARIGLITAMIVGLALLLPASAAAEQAISPSPRPSPQTPAPPPSPAPEPQDSVPDISLPPPRLNGQISVEAAIAARGQVQNLLRDQLTVDQLGQLSFAAFGPSVGPSVSARVLDPIGLYLVLENGVYRYNPVEHSLTRIARGDRRALLAGVVSPLRAVSEAPCSIVITGKSMQAAGQVAGTREMTLVSAGRAAAAIEMQALAMGLGAIMAERIGAPQVTEVLGLPNDEMPLCVLAVGHPATGPVVQPAEAARPDGSAAKTPRVLLIVPQRGIVDNEYDVVTTAFKAAGFDVTVASAAIGTHRTTTAREVQATVRLADVDVQAYDAIAFLGGPEARQYFQDPAARRIILDAVRTKKTLGALSTAPRILVNSGILVGMSVAANITERQAIAREGGIASTGEIEQVEVNGAVIITATGSRTAVQRFAQQFVEAVRIASETREEKRTRPAEPAR